MLTGPIDAASPLRRTFTLTDGIDGHVSNGSCCCFASAARRSLEAVVLTVRSVATERADLRTAATSAQFHLSADKRAGPVEVGGVVVVGAELCSSFSC